MKTKVNISLYLLRKKYIFFMNPVIKTKMSFRYAFLIFVIFSLSTSSKLIAQDVWKKAQKENYQDQKEIYQKKNFPLKFKLIYLDIDKLKNQLKPLSTGAKQFIKLPNSKGVLLAYEIKETSNFNAVLAAKFSMIKSYDAQGIDDPTAVAKISIGTDGFHAVIFSGNDGTVYIDPYSRDHKEYIVYRRADLGENKNTFECEVEQTSKKIISEQNFLRNANDGMLRTFRLAVVCSGEYAQFHLTAQGVSSEATDAIKKAAVLSAINTSMTRINGVFEKDLAVRMELVANNEEIIFLDAANDNISDGSAGTMINEVQSICDTVIGDENYDIGHVFSIGGSGLAGLGVVCITGQKARGVTGISSPTADPYDIDYVSHEMGHQFGANHTQNNSCNRNDATAVEPGSASTIMGYAGICAPNVQNNSDDHFHTISITEMWNIIQSSATCATLSNANNEAPTANAGADFNIPKSTPFVLKGSATDANGMGSLTYNWEQIDNEISTQSPESTNTGGPMFRSLPSKTSPVRYMPNLSTVVGGSVSSTWEVLPSVARDLNFSFLVRDNNLGGGNSARDDVKITVIEADAFTVSAPNTAVSWDVGTSQTITWNKGTTDIAPINCQNINIKLSVDGGISFPIMIKANTANDGLEDIIIPNNVSTTARIMIEAVDNIFYNVNITNFTINSIEPSFILTETSGSQTVCNSENQTAIYNLNFDFINDYSESVTFSASGQPTGSNVTFSATSVNSDETVTMTVSNLEGVTAQFYPIDIEASSSTITRNIRLELSVLSTTFSAQTLSSPENGETNVSLTEVLEWNTDVNATSYDLEVATDAQFENIIVAKNATANSYALTTSDGLIYSATYFWRVKAKNICGESNYSTMFSFATLNCAQCSSFGSSGTVDNSSTTLVQFNTIDNATTKSEAYNDYKSISTEVKQGETHVLIVNANTDGTRVTQTKVWIDWNQNCDFNDAGEEYDLGATEDTNGATSFSSLSISIPNDAAFGETVMRVSTKDTNPFEAATYPTSCGNNFRGEVEDYTIEVVSPTASVEDFSFKGFRMYPNPTKGTFILNLEVINTAKVSVQLFDIRGRLIGEKSYLNTSTSFSENILFEKANAGLYLVKITNGNKQTTKKLFIK
jgi:hypothetical protein